MFHFEKRDIKRETDLIGKIAKRIKINGLICICIQDTGKKLMILKDTIDCSEVDFAILNDSSLVYKYKNKETGHSSETKYCMMIIKKLKG